MTVLEKQAIQLKSGIFRLSTVLIVFACIHILLFFHDIAYPEAFLEGDRATQRMKSIDTVVQALESPTPLMEAFVKRGIPGDYIFHTLPYLLFESYSVIIVQILLNAVAVIFLYRLIYLLFHSQTVSTVASLFYVLLPGSLVQPHTLVTEAFYNPLLIVSFYYAVKFLLTKSAASLVVAALAASTALFIRLVFLLYPVLFFLIILLAFKNKGIKHAFSYLVLAMSVPLIWLGMYFFYTGEFSLGTPGSSISLNFYLRMERVAGLESIELNAADYPNREINAARFVEFLSKHPKGLIRTLQSDILNIGLNTGINTFAGRYLGLYTMPESNQYWKSIRDQQGFKESVREIFRWSTMFIVTNILVEFLWLLFLIFSSWGFILFLKDKKSSNVMKLTVITFPLYIVLSQFAASTPRWSHRTPAEFVLSIMVGLALVHFIKRTRGHYFRPGTT